MRILIRCLPAIVMLIIFYSPAVSDTGSKAPQTPTFTLWQLPEQTHSQMMSYVIRTSSGKLIVVDGGSAGDAAYLKTFLKGLSGKVEAWFISHPHPDHVDTLTEILLNPDGIEIKKIYASLPEEAWVRCYEPVFLETVRKFNKAIRDSHQIVTDLQIGSNLEIDCVRVEVLSVKNPEIHQNAINNSSLVLRMSDASKSVLFLGDLGVEGGEKLLHSIHRCRLHTDYVQMAHHGQGGVSEEAYHVINAAYCLWPTPKWLWANDSGQGKGSGSWKTLEVREWMDKLRVKRHFVTAVDGLSMIERSVELE